MSKHRQSHQNGFKTLTTFDVSVISVSFVVMLCRHLFVGVIFVTLSFVGVIFVGHISFVGFIFVSHISLVGVIFVDISLVCVIFGGL
jgi:hypothetical protein